METTSPITPETTVNQLLELRPQSIGILQEQGIDSCCGGSLPLREAALEAGTDIDLLLSLLLSQAEEQK